MSLRRQLPKNLLRYTFLGPALAVPIAYLIQIVYAGDEGRKLVHFLIVDVPYLLVLCAFALVPSFVTSIALTVGIPRVLPRVIEHWAYSPVAAFIAAVTTSFYALALDLNSLILLPFVAGAAISAVIVTWRWPPHEVHDAL